MLAEAVWRIIQRDGFDAASVRAVADEASLSTGSVRHFFGSQQELHVFAMEALLDRMGTQVRAVLDSVWVTVDTRSGWAPEQARQAVGAVLLELLPLTPDRRDLFRAQLQFMARSTVDPALQPMAARMADEIDRLVAHLVQSLVDTGAARADLDVAGTSIALALLLEGMNLRLLTAPQSLSVVDATHLVHTLLDDWAPR